MIPLTIRFCVGCGHVLDDLRPSHGTPSWVSAEAVRTRYGCGLDDVQLIEDTCPPCARVFAIARELSRPEPAGKLF